MRLRFFLPVLCLFVISTVLVALADETRLLRQPHLNDDQIVFVYAGDLWTVSIDGGNARKLTSFKGEELFPLFSPDGKWIAFSGEYAGTRQIYVIPSEGGVPRQLTFYPDVGAMPPRGGWDNIPMDWTPDGKKILFRSNRTPYGKRVGKYFLVDPFHEGLETPLQIPEGAFATLSPDGKQLAYSIKSREFRTWKRYRAGRAQDIWIYDLKKDQIQQLTTFPGTDNMPLWVGNRIYFTSDRKSVDSDEPRTLNIFVYDLDAQSIRQVTHFKEYDCLWPGRGKGGIVFENGGCIYHLDPETEKTRKISIRLLDDRPHRTPRYKNVKENIENYYLSPNAKRALFAARGEIFSVPEKHGDIINLTRTPAIREFNADWSPDGKYISYLSEKSGDYELYIREYGSDEPARQITKDTGAWITGYTWSPDSKKILFSDKKHRFQLLEVESGDLTLIDRGIYAPIGGYTWSGDSRWVAYEKDAPNHLTAVWLYSLDTEETYQLTDDRTNDFDPTFDPEGKYLYFYSYREFDYSDRDFEAKLFAGTLRADLPSPFAPRNDDEEPFEDDDEDDENKEEEEPEENENNNGKEDEKEQDPLVIDRDGFNARVAAFPLEAGSYRHLTAVENGLVYLRDGDLYKFDMEKREEKLIMKKVSGYLLNVKKDKFIYSSGTDYGIAALQPGQSPGEGALDLSGMELKIDPAVEWKQIYTDAWRIMRDWFYDPNMHGVDWKKIYDKYAPLIPHVAHRADLDYVLGELVGELNAGHTYIFPGDQPRMDRVPVGTLGCELEPDGKYYRITKIFTGENWTKQERSPLTESGVNVKEGEYIISIDGTEVTTEMNPYRLLENRAGKRVTLEINEKPKEKGAREVVVFPGKSDSALRHRAWVERNREIVDKLSNGRIGYIYVPNTAFAGFREFFRGWMEQSVKEGLIIDDRYNGGGHLPADMVFALSHPVLQYWAQRNLALHSTPYFVNEGPKVMLINGLASSGGDAFPDYFRRMEAGVLMGQTTWGGLIGYGYSPGFVDGGGMAVPSSAYVNTEGEWDVEAVGVKPDIEVFDDPTLIQAGREPMLEKAVEYILKELEKNPVPKVKTPKGPDRS